MVFLGCASTISNWEIPPSHPANPNAEEAKILKPLNPFNTNESVDPYRLRETQPLNQDSRSQGISSHDMHHRGHPNNIAHPKSDNAGHSERKDMFHNHKESNQ